MEKNKIIIVEGPQGTGKTTLTNYLRENIPGANLYRLSGQKDKTKTGKENSKVMYKALLSYLKQMEKIPMDLVFDRTFFTEEIYARLGYKDYSFTDVYQELVSQLDSLDYNIYLLLLYLENTDLYRERLARPSHHGYQSFSLSSSVNQQNEYLKFVEELQPTKINIIPLAMDEFDVSYQKVKELFSIK